jgi:prepilin-type N-terminal cleavage/methylation domain-containing protein
MRGTPARGFTLMELMVAIGLSAVIAVGLYSLSMVASQTFNQQQRISEIQLRLRTAMEMLRGDIGRAGYMSTPSSATDPNVCPRPSPAIQSVQLQRDTPNPTYDAADNTLINPVLLRLSGNYVSTDEYRVMGINGTTVYLQNQTLAYTRVPDNATFQRIFVNRWARITGSNGLMQIVKITGGTFQAPGAATYPTLSLATAPTIIGAGGAGCGIPGLGVGATIAPITTIQYRIATATNNFNESAVFATGRTDLIREELGPDAGGSVTPISGTQRVVADYAVDFDIAAVVDSAAPGALQPLLTRYPFGDARNFSALGALGNAGSQPERVRALAVRLSVRDRTQDPDFAWVQRAVVTDPLTRFRVFPTQSGAARVRSLTTEIELPNIALRNLHF